MSTLKSRKTDTRITLRELADRTNSELDGDGSIEICGAATITAATTGDITFVANERYLKFLATTKASAVVLDRQVPCTHLAVLRHDNPYLVFAEVVDILYPTEAKTAAGIDDSAIVSADATVAPDACIGPLCRVGGGTSIGRNTRLISSVYVGENVTIGENCLLYPGVAILNDCIIGNNVIIHPSGVIGSDGFGFAESDKGLKKVKQIGWVEIGDDVEIGAGTTIDRGALGPTKVGKGTKIDNLVQIAHNVEIGNNCIIVSQVGISGSTKLGNSVILAGQVGIVGHVEIGEGAVIGAQSGVSKSVGAGKTMFGYPAREIMQMKRIDACLTKLPELFKRVKKLEDES
ncbi:MAG: UDP-3-O-(3-hydroxymyristoyl)glucosamine N-acyltransferase [Candidatus Zixiibacteriota bacterium]|nr:MAG: UDP-3-O-(3-hydroxymyristoyl)glucosamine N-acyltransferase [candidate division Zixibacteria bacterium]